MDGYHNFHKVINDGQLALQGYDKGIIEKEELGSLMGINLDTGKTTKSWSVIEYNQTMLQMYDKKLITEDVLRKMVYGLEPKEVVTPKEDNRRKELEKENMKFKDSISKCSECSKEIEMTDMAEKILCSCGNHYFNPNYSKERANRGPDQIIMNKPLSSE